MGAKLLSHPYPVRAIPSRASLMQARLKRDVVRGLLLFRGH